jgi:2-methylcitrate dehydratase PrpD
VTLALSQELGTWTADTGFEDLPADVVDATKLRVLDVIGLTLAGAATAFGRASRSAARTVSGEGPCHVLGTDQKMGVGGAAFANAAAAQALEFDDTHNESIVHMSSPSVAAALALSETKTLTGKEFIASVAVGNEISCRVGSVAAGEFHKRGLHPTGLFAPFGVAYLAGRILGLGPDRMAAAAGIAGSFASGILECWVDGTESKFLHSGWAAQGGIMAADLARAGVSGPAGVFEGRFGFFASHLQDPGVPRDLARISRHLGKEWESRNASFKPFPAAHVLHPYISAALRLRARHGLAPDHIRQVRCPVAGFIVPIVCEPVEEKQTPASGSHGRVSLQYTLAEALCLGRLGRNAYSEESVRNGDILALARRIDYYVDPAYPGPGRFQGAVEIAMDDGRSFKETEPYNRGSRENPMSPEELREKFDDNAGDLLAEAARDRLADSVSRLEELADASVLVSLVT